MNEILMKLRKDAGYSQETLAEKIGVARDTILRYESGGLIPSDKLIRLADVFGVSTDYILGHSDFTKDGNEYIHDVIGFSDASINKFREIAAHDAILEKSNAANRKRLGKQGGVMPVIIPERMPFINFVFQSKHFINLVNAFIYYLSSDTYTHLLDDKFRKIGGSLHPADNDYIAGGSEIEINDDTNKALAKNLLDIHLEKMVTEYKAFDGAFCNQADANTPAAKKPRKRKINGK